MITVRRAQVDDLDSITDIYNDAVLKTTATFDTEPKTVEKQRAWFDNHGPRYPILVAKLGGVVAGWASLSKWSDRCAYADTAEVSLYVGEACRNKGLGKHLLQTITDTGRDVGLHTVIARIAEGNEVSIRLHEAAGFQHIGVMKEVGDKFGKRLDVYLMQKIFGGPPTGKRRIMILPAVHSTRKEPR